jgi:HK97 gp10 family phage protein
MATQGTLADIAPFVQAVTLQVADQIGQALVERARELVPVDTGALQASITYRVEQTGSGEVHIIFGGYTHYAAFVELGTYKMAAQPYLRPALDSIAAEIAQKFGAAFSTASSPNYGAH